MWREARAVRTPVAAWASIVEDPVKRKSYTAIRGHGGFVRSTWDEVNEIIAAANAYTAKTYGPDRVIGFSPIPAMSMVSYAAGSRYLSLLGGTRSEEHTSELQSLMRISYAVFCLKKQIIYHTNAPN